MIFWCLAEEWQTPLSRIVLVATLMHIPIPRSQHHSRSTSATTATPDVQCPFGLSVIACRLSRLCRQRFDEQIRSGCASLSRNYILYSDNNDYSTTISCLAIKGRWWERPRITFFLRYADSIVIRANEISVYGLFISILLSKLSLYHS